MKLKDTINLPETNFSMKGDLPKREPLFVQFWEERKVYERAIQKRKNGKFFILHDGPPYANGHIHLGQAMNKIVKDITVKYKMLKGFYTPFRPGWDAHGMPIENIVIKDFKEDEDILTIRKACREFASKWIEEQKKDFKRLGVLGDWENPYITMSKEYEGLELELLAKVVEKGYVYRGYMPVHWCPICETALAISEIEYKMMESPSLTFKMEGEEFDALIWTTTPWTIISNLALAVHPEYSYVVIEVNKKKFLLAKELLKENVEKGIWSNYEIIKEFKGEELKGIAFKHPFLDRKSSIHPAKFVTMNEGTGIVHIAPGHGREDYVLGREVGLPIYSPLDEKGRFTEEAGIFKGLSTEEASIKVLDILKEKGSLIHFNKIEHNYPICWRCKTPLIFRATEQWFISIEHRDLRKKALEVVRNTEWYPPQSEERMFAAVSDRPDWCISRQRKWGVNIPAFFCKKCKEALLKKDFILKVAELFKKNSADFWFQLTPEEILGKGYKCEKCGGLEWEKGTDILDVWFDSGISSFGALEEEFWPADVYLEGPDQHRGWFNSSLVLSLAIKDAPPYRKVVTHGWMLDSEGQSMHKSLGNVTTPSEIIEEFGADVLRLWIASVNWTLDVRYGREIIQRTVDAYRKIRNTFRFMLGNTYDFKESYSLKKEDLLPVDRFILIKLNRLIKEVTKNYESLHYYKVYRKFYDFVVTTLSSFYMDIIKDRLYVEAKDSKKRRSAQTVLFKLAKDLAIIIAPILSFTAEEVWQNLYGEDSIFLADFPEPGEETEEDKELLEKFEKILEVREEFHKILEKTQEDGFIGNSLEAKVFIKSNINELEEMKEYLKEIFIVSDVELTTLVNSKYIYEGKLGVYGIDKAEGKKCARCWMFSTSVGRDKEFENLCERCVNIIKGGNFELED
ncbi:MAG: isoleucine--tRNA ligase [candidate division WOR-3 bacterium]